ncbi:MAG: dipeptidase [Candidatus Abyssubacteria bacterium]
MIPIACDTLVALSEATADKSVILAKNSDRPADESQPLFQSPRLRHPPGAVLKCQYIEIPQASETLALIGSRPHWLWGFEHGMNECGVAIGNEAVFTKDALPEQGLLGMDLVRLGLERGRTARGALDVITLLIDQYGQGGSAFEHVEWGYSNSFIIADPLEAYVLETSGRQYAWKKVSGTASISNHIAIGTDWRGLSHNAREHAVSNGWWRDGANERLDFSAAYRSIEVAPPQISEGRLRQSQLLLAEHRGKITPEHMMRFLRDHYETGTVFTPGREPDDPHCYSICMHADPVGTTTASMVAHLSKNGPRTYWASLGNACCGVFMPLYVEGKLPSLLTRADSQFSGDSAWWLFKKLGERVAEDYAGRTPLVQNAWLELEAEFRRDAATVEAEARSLHAQERPAEADSLLSGFMKENLDKVLRRLRELLQEMG